MRRIQPRRDPRRIVAIGGGGFAAGRDDATLDRYVLDVTEQTSPRICLLPTASGDPEEQIARFYRTYGELPCEPTHLSLFRLGAKPVDLRTLLLGQDVIYVGGGSLLNLIAIWRAHGVGAILHEAWERGIVLSGISAGSMCWFTAGVTKGFGEPRAVPGLAMLPASNSVHYHGEPDRRPCFLAAVGCEAIPPGYGVDDGAGLLFAGADLVETVSSRPGAGAWWVEELQGEPVEVPLDVTRLSDPAGDDEPLSIAEFRRTRYERARRNRPATRTVQMGD